MAATWNVLIEAEAPDDAQSWPDIESNLVDALRDALGATHSGTASGNGRGYTAHISIEATAPTHGALWAEGRATRLAGCAD